MASLILGGPNKVGEKGWRLRNQCIPLSRIIVEALKRDNLCFQNWQCIRPKWGIEVLRPRSLISQEGIIVAILASKMVHLGCKSVILSTIRKTIANLGNLELGNTTCSNDIIFLSIYAILNPHLFAVPVSIFWEVKRWKGCRGFQWNEMKAEVKSKVEVKEVRRNKINIK